MFRPPRSTSRAGSPRLASTIRPVALQSLAVADRTLAIASTTLLLALMLCTLPPLALAGSAAEAPDNASEKWRARGLAFVDLPMGVRARFDSTYTRNPFQSDDLSLPYVTHTGPGIRGERSLESRFALTRPITDKIEFEISWGTRNSLASNDPMGFGRQTVGAFIRIAP